MSIYSAAIIGTDSAGCIAAITLARKGLSVLLIDASECSGDRTDISSSSNTKRSAWRSLHNQSLIAVAQAQGVEVWKACRIEAAIIEQGQLMGLTTERGTVRAYHMLDASGQRQWLSRQLGIPTKLSSPTFSPKWMDWFKPATWQMCDRFAGPGWFLLGDAAASTAPTTAYGLRTFTHRLKAAMSGLHAARAIADCEHNKISEVLAAQRYSQWLQTEFIRSSVTQRRREYIPHHSLA